MTKKPDSSSKETPTFVQETPAFIQETTTFVQETPAFIQETPTFIRCLSLKPRSRARFLLLLLLSSSSSFPLVPFLIGLRPLFLFCCYGFRIINPVRFVLPIRKDDERWRLPFSSLCTASVFPTRCCIDMTAYGPARNSARHLGAETQYSE